MGLRQAGRQALIGSLAIFGYLATVIVAIDLGVPPGTAALIAALQPLATAALAGVVLNEAVSARQWIGVYLAQAKSPSMCSESIPDGCPG